MMDIEVMLHQYSLWLNIQLIFHLSNLSLQSGNGGFVLGLDGPLEFLQLEFQVLVLAIQLGTNSLQSLGGAALCSQLCGQLVSLMSETKTDCKLEEKHHSNHSKIKKIANTLLSVTHHNFWSKVLPFLEIGLKTEMLLPATLIGVLGDWCCLWGI